MSLLRRILERRSTAGSAGDPRNPSYWLLKAFGWRPAVAGVAVTDDRVIGWPPIASGIRLLAETIASLPVRVYERIDPRGRRPLPFHAITRVLRDPNDEMTGHEFLELCQTHILLWGTSYSEIVFDGAGQPVRLWPINPDRVRPFRDKAGQLFYRIQRPSQPFGQVQGSSVLAAGDMLVVRGWSRYGLMGEILGEQFRETLGLGLATEEFAARFFGSGANASGFVEHPGALSESAQERLRTALENQVGGLDRSHRIMVLEEGMKFHQATIEPEKAQFLATRKFQVTEVARMLRIPPHMLYDLERSTFSNIEHQSIEFVVYSLLPWLSRWEQRFAKSFIATKSFQRLAVKFSVDGLLRGDVKSRFDAYAVGRQWGWLSANDIRELEELNPRAGGDIYLEPLNMALVGADGTIMTPTPPPPVNDNGSQPMMTDDDMEPEGEELDARQRFVQSR